jgi:hypothetical protein
MVTSILIGIIILAILFLIIFVIHKISKSLKLVKQSVETDSFWGRLIISVGQAIDQKIAADKAPKILSIAEKKKHLIENTGLKTFYYLDKDQIDLLYPQISSGVILSTMTIKESSDKKKSLSTSIPEAISVEIGKNNSNETVKSFNVSENIISKYNEVEKYFMEKNSLTFGIEEFDFDEQALSNFTRDCSTMETAYEYKISEIDQEAHWKQIKRKKAYSYLPTIKNASGYVVIQAEFLVKQISDINYILNYNHIINGFLDAKDAILIELLCNKTHLTPSALQNFKNEKSIQLTLIGKVIRFDNSENTLEISPIAIY